jgi:hypothetical protein
MVVTANNPEEIVVIQLGRTKEKRRVNVEWNCPITGHSKMLQLNDFKKSNTLTACLIQ